MANANSYRGDHCNSRYIAQFTEMYIYIYKEVKKNKKNKNYLK